MMGLRKHRSEQMLILLNLDDFLELIISHTNNFEIYQARISWRMAPPNNFVYLS
jgi:hypothetical protein